MISFLFSFSSLSRRLLCLVYFFIIIFLSLLPPSQFPEIPLFTGADKLIHLMMYMGLAWLVMWAFYKKHLLKTTHLLLFFSVPVWGALMEFMQLFMHQGRSFSWFDILSNFAGAILGVLVFKWMERARGREKKMASERSCDKRKMERVSDDIRINAFLK